MLCGHVLPGDRRSGGGCSSDTIPFTGLEFESASRLQSDLRCPISSPPGRSRIPRAAGPTPSDGAECDATRRSCSWRAKAARWSTHISAPLRASMRCWPAAASQTRKHVIVFVSSRPHMPWAHSPMPALAAETELASSLRFNWMLLRVAFGFVRPRSALSIKGGQDVTMVTPLHELFFAHPARSLELAPRPNWRVRRMDFLGGKQFSPECGQNCRFPESFLRAARAAECRAGHRRLQRRAVRSRLSAARALGTLQDDGHARHIAVAAEPDVANRRSVPGHALSLEPARRARSDPGVKGLAHQESGLCGPSRLGDRGGLPRHVQGEAVSSPSSTATGPCMSPRHEHSAY